jgi:hypothetical protein
MLFLSMNMILVQGSHGHKLTIEANICSRKWLYVINYYYKKKKLLACWGQQLTFYLKEKLVHWVELACYFTFYFFAGLMFPALIHTSTHLKGGIFGVPRFHKRESQFSIRTPCKFSFQPAYVDMYSLSRRRKILSQEKGNMIIVAA